MESPEIRLTDAELVELAETLVRFPDAPAQPGVMTVDEAVNEVVDRVLYFGLDLNGLSPELSSLVIKTGDIGA